MHRHAIVYCCCFAFFVQSLVRTLLTRFARRKGRPANRAAPFVLVTAFNSKILAILIGVAIRVLIRQRVAGGQAGVGRDVWAQAHGDA